LILGHEPAGEIVAVGDGVWPRRVGERVAIEPGVPCRRCDYCKRGRYNLCAEVVFLATPPVDGAFAEYLAVPSDFAHAVSEHLPLAAAALVEPTAVAVHAARLAHVEPGERCLIFGAGPVGLLLALVLRASRKASVGIVDPDASRRQLAEQLGVAAYPADAVADVAGVDAAFDASGNSRALAAARVDTAGGSGGQPLAALGVACARRINRLSSEFCFSFKRRNCLACEAERLRPSVQAARRR
jgi:L-iditol 2-dehydrogenase